MQVWFIIDIFEDILSRLSNNDACSLAISSSLMLKKIKKILKQQTYWKRRTERIFNFNFKPRDNADWKNICEFAIKNPRIYSCEKIMDKGKIIDDYHFMENKFRILLENGNLYMSKVCKYGDIDLVKILIEELSIKIDYNFSYLVLNSAIKSRNIELVKYIVNDCKINPTVSQNLDNLDSLSTAIFIGNTEITKFLIEDTRIYQYISKNRDNMFFIDACQYGKLSVVKLLMCYDIIDQTCYNNTAFIHACINGYHSIVKLLLKSDHINPTDQNNKAIIDACKYKQYKVIKLLLKDGRADPSTKNNTAIVRACIRGHYSVVKLLLNSKRIRQDTRNRAFYLACGNGHYKIANLLLGYIQINSIMDASMSKALENKHYKIIKLLLEHTAVDLEIISLSFIKYCNIEKTFTFEMFSNTMSSEGLNSNSMEIIKCLTSEELNHAIVAGPVTYTKGNRHFCNWYKNDMPSQYNLTCIGNNFNFFNMPQYTVNENVIYEGYNIQHTPDTYIKAYNIRGYNGKMIMISLFERARETKVDNESYKYICPWLVQLRIWTNYTPEEKICGYENLEVAFHKVVRKTIKLIQFKYK
jgi:ankyrin repeat protein